MKIKCSRGQVRHGAKVWYTVCVCMCVCVCAHVCMSMCVCVSKGTLT